MTHIKPPMLFALAFVCGLGGGSALAADTAGFNGQVINGDGISNPGDTFVFQGVAVPSCPAAATSRANPYKE